jgi:hypothetical protein
MVEYLRVKESVDFNQVVKTLMEAKRLQIQNAENPKVRTQALNVSEHFQLRLLFKGKVYFVDIYANQSTIDKKADAVVIND